MSHIFLKKDQKEELKRIIFNLTNVKQSEGKIIMTKRRNTKMIYTEVYIPKDIVKIICDYDEEEMVLSISSFICYCSKDSLSLRIKVKLESYFDMIFIIRFNILHRGLCAKLCIYNIMHNIIDYRTYNETKLNELDVINKYKITSKNDWVYNYLTLPTFNDNINIDEIVDFFYFFNCYIKKYYNKINYIKTTSACGSWTMNDNIFVHNIKLWNGLYDITLIHPLDHKKLKNIIVMLKVLQIQLSTITNEIMNNTHLLSSFIQFQRENL